MNNPIKKTKEEGLVPELRFPEFREKGTWKRKELGKLSDILRGGSPRPIDKFMTMDHDGLNWLKIGDVDKNAKYIAMTKERVIVEALSKTREVHPGDLIMSNSMSFGRPYIMEIKTCIHDGWIAVTEIKNDINLDYLYYFILSDSAQYYFLNSAAGGGIKNLNADIIKLLLITYPALNNEQQKIADCLSSLDDLVSAHSKKLDSLKAHKKGLMQQLFPAEDETIPKLRFPEFQGKSKWIEMAIKRIFSIFQGYAFSSNDSVTEGIRWLKIADVSIQKMNHNAASYLPLSHKIKNEKFTVKFGDYVMALTRPILKNQLKIAKIDKVFDGALLNQRVGKLVTKENSIFVYYLIQTSKLVRDIEKSIAGSEPPNLSVQQIADIKTNIPLKKEQQKIADCLSSLDDLIAAQSKKIEALKSHKKGLMQQLFPTVNEISA